MFSQVTDARHWYDAGHFANEDEARGAFKLAYQKGLDGMGKSIQEWMRLSDHDYAAWMRERALPVKRRKRRRAGPPTTT